MRQTAACLPGKTGPFRRRGSTRKYSGHFRSRASFYTDCFVRTNRWHKPWRGGVLRESFAWRPRFPSPLPRPSLDPLERDDDVGSRSFTGFLKFLKARWKVAGTLLGRNSRQWYESIIHRAILPALALARQVVRRMIYRTSPPSLLIPCLLADTLFLHFTLRGEKVHGNRVWRGRDFLFLSIYI